MNGIANFLGILFLGWFIVFLLHQALGGILGIFYRGLRKKHAIEIVNARNKQ